uniref:Inositol hexakisphosphate and diphosphoinositol-pentakisphosphate kinase n=1 Tax=Anopheles minimus TaxID=112268 RepID=A0A182VT33_9DIPT
MEWSRLRDWWRMAKFRRGDRTNPAVQHHRRRGSGNAVSSAYTTNVPGDTDGNTEQLLGEGEPHHPVRFFVDRLDNPEDGDGEEQMVFDGDDPDRASYSDTGLDRQVYSDSEAMYDHLFCDCEQCSMMNGDLDPTDGLDSDDSSTSGKQVVVAVCAMSKKSQSKPMKEILTRLQEFEFIRMVVIGEDIILNEPVDRWPLCDCLISFHSKGFPLEKAIQYAQLRQPYVINNLHMQFDIQDRRRVYAILEKEGIEIPRYAVLDRDSPDPKQHELVESEDHVEVNGIVFNKPFVEKPVSAEDHNIYIYYPTSAGGGSQRLFRKIGSRSSVYSPESRVRKTGSFIYEDFMPTDGTDVKVYTVGPDYAHAEARKSPALDGKVERDSDGKEIRYPVILSNAEKLISRKVCLAFKQTVCGFDLLRANGKSFVCDVNGFSFVKNSNKYYDDCAKILGNMILRELAPQLHIPWSVPFQLDDPPIVPTTFGKMMELRCVTAVIRHGDRTPKQKMKVEVRHQKFFEIFEKYDGYRYGHIKLKRPKQLQEILDIARSLLAEIQTKAADSEIEEKQSKLEQLKSVLEMYGHFSGINRKVQMKYQPKGRPRGSSSDDADAPKEPSLVLILKWGGELTPAGRIQAEELGRIFRCMYPGGQSRQPGVGEGPGAQGLGLLRLHSTFRHDLKIYASDEGRVQMTAAAFAKGLLALEGELTPILVQMVKSANTNGLLDNDCDSSKYQNMAKSRLHELMQIDREFTIEDRTAINPGNAISINLAMNFVKNPVQCCAQVHSLIRSLMAVVAVKRDDPKTRDAVLYHGETWELMGRRWGKIEKDFCTKNKSYDISKIPDIYDCIKYDLQHNQHTLQFDLAEELYISAKYLADIVIPQEYGLTMHEKLTIGQGICTPLLKKIRADLQRNIEELGGEESVNRLNPRYSHGVSSPGRHVRTRLYFTSESHVHSLLTVLRHGGLLNVLTDEQWRRAMEYVSMVSELNYMSQIVIMLYEDPMKDPSSEERFHVELHFSPGVNCCVQKNLPPGPGFRPHSRNDSVTSKNASGDEDTTSRIEEENDTEEENSFSHNSSLHHTPTKSLTRADTDIDYIGAGVASAVVKERRIKKNKSSSPIPIDQHNEGCNRCDVCEPFRLESHGPFAQVDLTFSALPSLRAREEGVNCSSEPLYDGADVPKLTRALKIKEKEEDIDADKTQSNRPSLYIGPPECSYSCDSISEFTPNLEDQELYVSSFSESEDEKDANGDAYEDASESEPSQYYSALDQHESEIDRAIGHTYLRRSLSYTFSNDPDRYHQSAEDNYWPCGRKMSSVELDESRTMSLMTRSFDELLIDTNGKWCGENRNCYCRYCWVSQMPRFSLQIKDISETNPNTRRSRSLSPPYLSVMRFRSNTTDGASQTVASNPSTLQVPGDKNVIRHDSSDHGRLRLVRYPVRAMTRFASDPSLPLGLAWAEANNASDKAIGFRSSPGTENPVDSPAESTHQLVFVTLTTPPPDEDDSEPLLGQFYNCVGTTQARTFDLDCAAVLKMPPSLCSNQARALCSGKDGNDEQCHTANSVCSCTHFDAIQHSCDASVHPSTDHDGSCSPSIYSFAQISSNAPLTVPFPQPPSNQVLAHIVSTNFAMQPLSCVETYSNSENITAITNPLTVPLCTNSLSTINSNISNRSTHVDCTSTTSITNATTTTTSFLITVATSSSVTTTDTTVCSTVAIPCVTSVADTSNILSTCSSYVHTTNTTTTSAIGSLTIPSLVPVVSERKQTHCPTKLFVKSYTIDGSSGAGYSSMMATAISTTTTTITTTTTTTVSEAGDAATAAEPNDDVVRNITSTSSTITGSCLYCCTGGTITVPRMAGPGALSHGSGSLSSCCCCCCCCCATPSSSAGGLAGTGVGGPTGTSNATTVRRQRHSIAGQMSYFKMLGTFSKKMATSTNSLFSTAVISGSSSAPNLRDMIPNTASPSGFGGVPPIRPLETLHNALSLKQLDAFLERMTTGPLFKTPASSPPPKHPVLTAATASTLPIAGSKSPMSVVNREHFPEGPTTLAQPASIAPLTGSVEEKGTGRPAIRDFAPFASVGQQGATAATGGMPGVSTNSTNGTNATGAQQSWSDHSSSMTSSISALSSGGPSSPNYSEVYSRGCPSSDMSASITSSTDGLAAIAGGGGTSEQLVALPQLFTHPQHAAPGARMSPKHPFIELSAVESFGKFGDEDTKQQDEQQLACAGDTIVAVRQDRSCECSSTADAYLRRSSTMDISGDLTPVSGCSDWESNTNDATKGSTTNYDLTTTNTTEEDDEDATISTDTCLSVGDQEQQQWSLKTSLELSSITTAGSVPSARSSLSSTFPGEFRFDAPVLGRNVSLDSGGKLDSRVRGSRIQRQISLYENETRTLETNPLSKAHEWCGEGHKVESGEAIESCTVQMNRQHPYPYSPQVLQTLHMSYDELRRELPNSERNTRFRQEQSAHVCSTEEPKKIVSKNLASLSVAQQRTSSTVQDSIGSTPLAIHTPGALVIREGYIEPPRLTRVTKSFHGKTDHQKLSIELQQQDAVRAAVDSVGGVIRRSSDSPALETSRYSKSTLRQQHSSAGTSSCQGRFTTSIVQEAEQLNAVDEASATNPKQVPETNSSLSK